MPNIRIPDYWRQQVKYILAENQRISISDILHLLDAKAELLQKSDEATERTLSNNVPSPRTISRVRDEWRAMESELDLLGGSVKLRRRYVGYLDESGR